MSTLNCIDKFKKAQLVVSSLAEPFNDEFKLSFPTTDYNNATKKQEETDQDEEEQHAMIGVRDNPRIGHGNQMMSVPKVMVIPFYLLWRCTP